MSARGKTTGSSASAKDTSYTLGIDGNENDDTAAVGDNERPSSSIQRHLLAAMMVIAWILVFVIFVTIPSFLPNAEKYDMSTHVSIICLLFVAGSLLFYHRLLLEYFGCGTTKARKQSQFDDFDAIVAGMADQVIEGGGRCIPIERSLPEHDDHSHPGYKTFDFHLEERVDEITQRKSRMASEEGASIFRNSHCVLRLHFPKETIDGGITILASRTYTRSEENPMAAANRVIIQKGLLSTATKKAYWVEELLSSDQRQGARRRVVVGQFEGDGYTSFSGEWLSSDATRGSLVTADNYEVKEPGTEHSCTPFDSMV